MIINYLVLDVPNNCEKLKKLITEKYDDLLNNDKINDFLSKCDNKNFFKLS